MTTSTEDAGRPLPLRPWFGSFVLIVGAYVMVALVSVLNGTPKKLPGVALGFPLLLHLERAGAVLAAIGAVLVVARLAWLGELPNQLGNIGYASFERRHEFEQSAAELRQHVEVRFDRFEQDREADVQSTEEALRLTRSELAELDRRLSTVETQEAG